VARRNGELTDGVGNDGGILFVVLWALRNRWYVGVPQIANA
jgi:hypothetical protein